MEELNSNLLNCRSSFIRITKFNTINNINLNFENLYASEKHRFLGLHTCNGITCNTVFVQPVYVMQVKITTFPEFTVA